MPSTTGADTRNGHVPGRFPVEIGGNSPPGTTGLSGLRPDPSGQEEATTATAIKAVQSFFHIVIF